MSNRSEQHRLAGRWLDGTLTEAELAQLVDLARTNPDLRSELASLLAIERLLGQSGPHASAPHVFAAEVVARLNNQVGDPAQLATRVVHRIQDLQSTTGGCAPSGVTSENPRRHTRGFWISLAAAFLLLGVLAATLIGTLNQNHVVVSGAEAVVLAPGQAPIRVGTRLRGGVVDISGGFVRVRFPSGATVLLEGPAKLKVLGSNKARLEHGKAVADVPFPATGFIMESPDAHVLDLGTKFGMKVGASNGTEVHVLEGNVEAASLDKGTARSLAESEGAHISSSGTVALPADQTLFLTELPPIRSGPAHFIRWSFDEGQGYLAKSFGSMVTPGSEALLKTMSLDPPAARPEWTPGRFGSGLRFDGVDDYAVTGFKGIEGGSPRTVALWVRVPRDWEPVNGFALVSWGTIQAPGGVWQISINPEEEDGPVGRLRVGVQGAQVIGSRDLRDGQWHHLAAVLYSSKTLPATTTQILLYVDGQLEAAERRAVQAVQTKIDDASAIPVTFGRNSDTLPKEGRYLFRGDMDEIYIVDVALSQTEIENLTQRNVLPADHSLARN